MQVGVLDRVVEVQTGNQGYAGWWWFIRSGSGTGGGGGAGAVGN
jgi:hypothetical protein